MVQGQLTYHVTLGNKAEMKYLHNPFQITGILRHPPLCFVSPQPRLLLSMHRDMIRKLRRLVANNADDLWFILNRVKCQLCSFYARSSIFLSTQSIAENYIFTLTSYIAINTPTYLCFCFRLYCYRLNKTAMYLW